MQDDIKPVSAKPSLEDLLDLSTEITRQILARSVEIIDAQFGENYAVRNPMTTERIARMLCEDFQILRAHHGKPSK